MTTKTPEQIESHKIRTRIQSFISYHIKFFKRYNSFRTHGDTLIRKQGYILILETLSKSYKLQESSPAKRMKAFIRDFKLDENLDRVSLVQMYHAHIEVDEVYPSELLKAVTNHMDTFPSAPSPVYIGSDPTFEEMKSRFPAYNKFEKFQHLSLLYSMRNRLIHEFRNSGNGYEFESRFISDQFYERVDEIPPGDGPLILGLPELLFPASYLEKLARFGIMKYLKYLRKNKIDPITNRRNKSYYNDK